VDAAMKGVKEVYHCAAMVTFQPGTYQRMMKINGDGTANMVNFAMQHGVEKFCHVSSVAALGRLEESSVVDENSFWKTSKKNSSYAVSKYAAEREVWRAMEEGLKAVIVCPTIIIGQGDWKSGSSQIFAQIDKGLKFYTKGYSGFVDVKDVTRCMMELMERNIFGERFIISAENICWKDFLTDVALNLGKKPPSIYATKFLGEFAWRADALKRILTGYKSLITKETARQGHMQSTYSNEKIRKALGAEFIPIKKSIEETARIFLKQV
jgi:nucleoside-diphosphate-sugar epimerase